MSEADWEFCKTERGRRVRDSAWSGGSLAFHGLAGGYLAQVLVVPEAQVASPEEIRRLPAGRVRTTDVADSGYTVGINDGSKEGHDVFLHSHVVGGGK